MEPARTWLPRALAALAFAVFAASAPAGPYWQGAADAAAGAISFGTPASVPHPAALAVTGAASLIPLGELAFRIHLVSAVLGALAVLWSARLVIEVGREDLASLVGAAVAAAGLAVAMPLFREATIAGTGALAAAMAALAWLLLVRVARGDGARAGIALALVAGVGLATHAAFIALTPVIAALFWLRVRRGARWPLAAPLAGAGVAAALLSYLPVRAGGAFSDQPATFGGLWTHVVPPLQVAASRGPDDGLGALAVSAEALGAGMVVAALGGAIWLALARKERWLLVAIAALVAGEVFAGARVAREGEPIAGGVLFAVAAAVLAGAGIAWLARRLGRAGACAGAASGVIVVVPAALVGWGSILSGAPGQGARALADAAIESAPPRGVALIRTDAAKSSLRYVMTAEHARPDLLLRSQREGEIPGGPRPVVWELGPEPPGAGFDLWVDRAPFARLVSAGEGGGDLEHAARILASLARLDPGEPTGARVIADALVQLGALARARGDAALAHKLVTASLALDPASPVARAQLRALD